MCTRQLAIALTTIALAGYAATAVAQPGDAGGLTPIDEGATHGGTIVSGTGVSPPEGDLVYRSTTTSAYFHRPYPGYRDYDDIHLEPGATGDLVKYSVTVFGSTVSGADAGSPFDVVSALWTSDTGDPATGIPDAVIPGTDCLFVGIPAGGLFTLECVVPTSISIPDGLWMALEFSTDNAGWITADADDCPRTGPPGYSEDFFLEQDLITGAFTFFFFGPGCPFDLPASYGDAMIVAEGAPWACCELSTYECANVQETECLDLGGVFTEGTLCNDLPTPCSEAGACCHTATGQCTDTFAIHCDGFLEAFSVGQLCTDVECEVPPNVPTLTRWGVVVLTILFLSSLTIAFGRRRIAEA